MWDWIEVAVRVRVRGCVDRAEFVEGDNGFGVGSGSGSGSAGRDEEEVWDGACDEECGVVTLMSRREVVVGVTPKVRNDDAI